MSGLRQSPFGQKQSLEALTQAAASGWLLMLKVKRSSGCWMAQPYCSHSAKGYAPLRAFLH